MDESWMSPEFKARLALERAAQRDVIRLIRSIPCMPVFITDTAPLEPPPLLHRIRRRKET